MPRDQSPRQHLFVVMITLQQYIATWMHWIVMWWRGLGFGFGLWERWFGAVLVLDSGISVRVGQELAHGGFSVVFRATDVNNRGQVYALKRIRCHDEQEMLQACDHEAEVHRALQQSNPQNANYTMPLYGMAFSEHNEFCYMLFPLFPHSLRQEVNARIFEQQPQQHGGGGATRTRTRTSSSRMPPPWSSESVVLQLFQHLCQGVATMHAAGYSHRDIKLENILCKGSNAHHLANPVLMDFGSAGPLKRSLATRQDVNEIAELASQHTTVSYRPPELFPGELRVVVSSAGEDANNDDLDLDYAKVDVWSLGCVLFAILYGASPFECDFHRRTGQLQIQDCTHNRVLGKVPKPPKETPPSHWYSQELTELMDWILTKDRHQRPTLAHVQSRVQFLLNPRQQIMDVEENLFDLQLFSSRTILYSPTL
jgi:serine/threonine kinase 16